MIGERVERHLAVAPTVGETGGAKRAKVVRDEVLGALHDPSEIADAELVCITQSQRNRQPRWISESMEAGRGHLGRIVGETHLPQPFCERQVQTEEIALIAAGHLQHTNVH